MVLQQISATMLSAVLYISLSTAAASQDLKSVLGCYLVEVGVWSGSFPSGWPEVHQPPSRIVLDSTRVILSTRDTTVRWRVEPNVAVITGSLVRFPPSWQFARADSLRITWSTGFAGVAVTLAVRADSLRGIARAFHDVIGPVQPTAPVLLRRVTCAPFIAPAGN